MMTERLDLLTPEEKNLLLTMQVTLDEARCCIEGGGGEAVMIKLDCGDGQYVTVASTIIADTVWLDCHTLYDQLNAFPDQASQRLAQRVSELGSMFQVLANLMDAYRDIDPVNPSLSGNVKGRTRQEVVKPALRIAEESLKQTEDAAMRWRVRLRSEAVRRRREAAKKQADPA